MTARRALIAYYLLLLVYGGLSGHLEAQHRHVPRGLEFLFMVGTVVLLYLWYYLDATARRYRRSPLLGGAIILMSFVAIPYYLVRSRPAGQRLKALGRFLGGALLSLVTVLLGGLPFVLMASGS